IINPGEFSPANSIEIVIWVALGGRGTLVGAALGAILVAGAKTLLTGWIPEIWLFALGALFVFVTIFLPTGVLGLIEGRQGGQAASRDRSAAREDGLDLEVRPEAMRGEGRP
ncbi:MAG: urea ABC transporter permease subunit UrtC, partial [Pseudomonadota bacterium]